MTSSLARWPSALLVLLAVLATVLLSCHTATAAAPGFRKSVEVLRIEDLPDLDVEQQNELGLDLDVEVDVVHRQSFKVSDDLASMKLESMPMSNDEDAREFARWVLDNEATDAFGTGSGDDDESSTGESWAEASSTGGSESSQSSTGGVSVYPPSALSLSVVNNTLSVAQFSTVSITVSSVSGSAADSFSITPSLSSGLSLNTATGAISGSANALPSLVTYTVTATNAAGSTTASFTLTIVAAAPSSLSLGRAAFSVAAYTVIVNAPVVRSVVGTPPITFSLASLLPAGLSLNATSGAVSGVPTVVTATTTYTLTASNSAGSVSATFTLNVTAAAPSALSYAAASVVFTDGVTNSVAVSAITGTAPIVYTVQPTLPTGITINSATGAISGSSTTLQSATTYTVTATNSVGSTTATVSIAVVARAPSSLVLSTYAVALVVGASSTSIISVSSIVGTTGFTYTVTPTLPTGLSLSATTGVISGAATTAQAATSYVYKATNAAGSVNTTVSIAVVTSIVAPSALTLSSSSATYVLDTAQTITVVSVNGTRPLSFTVTPALPAGLSINVLTGAISGTATVAQSATIYTVRAANAQGSTTATVTITVSVVAPAGLTLSVTSSVLRVSQAASITASLTAGFMPVYTVSPTLPAGLSINSATGTISGTPTAVSAATNYTVTATNSAGSTTATVSLTVSLLAPSALTLSVASLDLTAGVYGSVEVVSIAGSVPVVYTVSPTLPTGLSISSSTGAITGSASTLQAATTYTITATNSVGSTTATVSIAVLRRAPSALVMWPPAAVFVGGSSATSISVLSVIGTASITYSITPTLPAGLSIDAATGTISGSPTVGLSATIFTVTATNSRGSTTATVTITVLMLAPRTLVLSTSVGAFLRNQLITPITVSSVAGLVASYSVSPVLPTGLLISSTTGTISGTPTVASDLTLYTVTATNTGGSTTATVRIAVVNAILAPSALTLSSASLALSVGVAGGVTVTSVAGTPVFTYTITPSLPTGLSISSSTGAVSGTALSVQAATTYTITATNTQGSTTATLSITVAVQVPSALTLSTASQVFIVGTSNSVAVSSITGTVPVVYTVSPTLPTGLSISASTGLIAGTATTAKAATTYTVTATNSAGSTTATVSITASLAAPSNLVLSASSLTFVSKVAGTSLTVVSVQGSAPITYTITPELPAGVSISSVSGRISGTPTAGTAKAATVHTVTAANSAGSTSATVTITVTVVAPSSLVLSSSVAAFVANIANTITVSSVSGTTPLVYTVSPTLPTGVTINSATGTITGTTTTASASQVYTVTATNSAGSTTATITLSAVLSIVKASGISLSSSSVTLPTGATAAISVSSVTAGTAPFVWSVSPALPTGLSISSSTGAITGSAAGVSPSTTYTVTATNSAGSGSATLVLAVVLQAPSALTLSASTVTVTAGVTSSTLLTVSSVTGSLPVVYTVSSLPVGLSISSSTGAISGAVSGQVTATTSVTYTVTATNSMGSTTATFTLSVVVVAPSALLMDGGLIPASPFVFTAGLQNAVGVATITGSGPFVYSLSAADRAIVEGAGLAFSASSGRIYGSATSGHASVSITVTASNSAGTTSASTQIIINVVAPSNLKLSTSLSSDTITFKSGFPNSVTVLSVSGTLPVVYTATTLPVGLSINSATGTISGDGLVNGTTEVTVTATNAQGSTTAGVIIDVIVAAPSLLKLSTARLNAVTGIATAVTVSSVAGTLPMTFTVEPTLPTGLSLNAATGAITGAATAASTATTYTVTATNAAGSATATVVIATASAAATLVPVGFSYSSPSASYIINTKIPANKPTVVASGSLTYTISDTLPAGLSLSATGYIKGTPTAFADSKTYTITVSNSYGSATFQVTLEVTATAPSGFSYLYNPIGYVINTEIINTPTVSGTRSGMTYTIGDGAVPTGCSLDASTGYISGAPTVAGVGRVTIFASNRGGVAATTVVWVVSSSAIAPSDLSYGVAEIAYPSLGADSVTVPVFFGSAPIFTVTPALPAGLVIGENTGIISGLPTELSSAVHTITATNDAGSVSVELTITVTQVPPQVVVYASRFSACKQGTAVTNTVTMTPAVGSEAAGTYTFTASSLPAGLSIDQRTGVVSGTPTEKSDGTAYTITVSNAQGSLTFALNVRVIAADAVVVATPVVPMALGFPMSLAAFTTTLREQMLQEVANKLGLKRSLISLLKAFAPVLLNEGMHTESSGFHVQRLAAGESSSFATSEETGGLSVELAIDTSETDAAAVESYVVQQQEAEEFELPTFGSATVSSEVTITGDVSSSGSDVSSSGAASSTGASATSSGSTVVLGSSEDVGGWRWGSAGGVVVAVIITFLCLAIVIGAYRFFSRRSDAKRLAADDEMLVEVVSPHHAVDVNPSFAPDAAAPAQSYQASAAAGAPLSLSYAS